MEMGRWQTHLEKECQQICQRHGLSLGVFSYLRFLGHHINGQRVVVKITGPQEKLPGFMTGFVARGNAWIKARGDMSYPPFYTIHIIKQKVNKHTALLLDMYDFLTSRSGCPTQAALRQAVRRLCESRITAKTAQTAR